MVPLPPPALLHPAALPPNPHSDRSAAARCPLPAARTLHTAGPDRHDGRHTPLCLAGAARQRDPVHRAAGPRPIRGLAAAAVQQRGVCGGAAAVGGRCGRFITQSCWLGCFCCPHKHPDPHQNSPCCTPPLTPPCSATPTSTWWWTSPPSGRCWQTGCRTCGRAGRWRRRRCPGPWWRVQRRRRRQRMEAGSSARRLVEPLGLICLLHCVLAYFICLSYFFKT